MTKIPSLDQLKEFEDYYKLPNGAIVYTEKYHLDRGHCCGSGCLHCPYGDSDEQSATDSKENTYYAIQCPFCFEKFEIHLYSEEGQHQSMIYDCEICCRPIQLEIEFKAGVAEIIAKGTEDSR